MVTCERKLRPSVRMLRVRLIKGRVIVYNFGVERRRKKSLVIIYHSGLIKVETIATRSISCVIATCAAKGEAIAASISVWFSSNRHVWGGISPVNRSLVEGICDPHLGSGWALPVEEHPLQIYNFFHSLMEIL